MTAGLLVAYVRACVCACVLIALQKCVGFSFTFHFVFAHVSLVAPHDKRLNKSKIKTAGSH